MINFENMTVAQMKHYLKPGALQKLDNAELGQLLSASRGIRDHFAKERGLDASLETAYWNAAEKEIVREFRNRNISVTVMTCLLYTSPSPRDRQKSRMPSSA